MGRLRNKLLPNETRRKDLKSIRFVYLTVILGAFVIWFIALIIRSSLFRRGFSMDDILDRILDNLLGIIPPMIMVDIALNFFLRDFTASEMSEQITTTLMGKSDAIDLFDEKTKINFIKTAIHSLMGREKGEMVFNLVEPYFNDGSMNLRQFLNYKIVLQEYRNSSTPFPELFPDDQYIRIKESLTYSVKYTGERKKQNKFQIGFFRDENELDTNLRSQNFVFSESLHVNVEDLRKLVAISPEEKLLFVNKFMRLHVTINDELSSVSKVEISERGIFVTMNCHKDPGDEVHTDIAFSMPWRRGICAFYVAIKEPTYQPSILLEYPETMMSVSMIPFMNVKCSSERCTLHEGTCEVKIVNEWVVPSSGVAFYIDTEHAIIN